MMGGLSGIGGAGFMSLALKESKDELRLSKKAEQLSKEKLVDCQKKLEQTEEAYYKYRQDSEARIDALRTENSIINVRLQHMHEQNEALERSSSQSMQNSQGQDMLKIVEEYSKQNESKAKEIDCLLQKVLQKKTQKSGIKKHAAEMEQRSLRLQSKLENMTKFCRIFIKSIKLQNKSLHDIVKQQQSEIITQFQRYQNEIGQDLKLKVTQIRNQFESQLLLEKENNQNLKQQLSLTKEAPQLVLQLDVVQKQLNFQKEKTEKYKSKLRQQVVQMSDQEGHTHQLDVQNIKIENLKQKHESIIQEKDVQIQNLSKQIELLVKRETEVLKKLESVDSAARQEYQRLVELHEGSSRYREIRDLYEEKLTRRDEQLMDTQKELIKNQIRLEFVQIDVSKYQQAEQQQKEKIDNLQLNLKELESKTKQQQINFEKSIYEAHQNQIKLEQKLQESESSLSFVKADLQKAYSDNLEIQKIKESHNKVVESNLVIIETLQSKYQYELDKIDQMQKKHQDELEVLREKSQLELSQMKQNSLIEVNIKDQQILEINTQLQSQKEEILQIQENQRVSETLQIKSLQEINLNHEKELQILKSSETQLLANIQSLNIVNDARIDEIVQLRMALQEDEVQQPNYTTKIAELQNEIHQLNQVLTQKTADLISKKQIDQLCQTEPVEIEVVSILSQQDIIMASDKIIMNNSTIQTPTVKIEPKVTQPIVTKKAGFPMKPQTTVPIETSKLVVEEIIQPKIIEPLQAAVQKEQEIKDKPKTPKAKVQPLPPNIEHPQQAQGWYGTIYNSFMSLLTKKKQAYTGKPSSAMYFDEKKKRWIIEGEDESDDDVPPPPPPKTSKKEETKIIEAPQDSSGLISSLTTTAFAGSFVNRNRKDRSKTKQTPATIPEQPKQIEEPKHQTELQFDNLNQTGDQNLTIGTINESMITANESLSQTMIMQQIQLSQEQEEKFRERETEWKQKYSKQSERITNQRQKILHLQEALKTEKQQTHQTIKELEQFSTQMESAGQQNQEQLQDLKIQLAQAQDSLKIQEMWLGSTQDNLSETMQELDQVRTECRVIKQRLFSQEMDSQIKEMNQQIQIEEYASKLRLQESDLCLREQIEDQCELFKWQLALEQQTTNKLQNQNQDISKQIEVLQNLNNQQKHELSYLQRNLQDQSKKSDEEKQQIKLSIDKEYQKQIEKHLQVIKRFESDKVLRQQDLIRQLQEKDQIYWQQLEEQEHQHQKEIQNLQDQLQTQATQLKESIHHEKQMIKKQLNNLQDLVSKKDEDLQTTKSEAREAQQELQQMLELKHKFNDHIIYLQNEIRKRDELLENDSEFDDYSVDDSSNISQDLPKKLKKSNATLDKATKEIKLLLDSKIQLQRQNSMLSQKLNQLEGGMEQIYSLMSSDPVQGTEQIISKFFQFQNDHESQVIEMQHQIDQTNLLLQNTSNLQFDIELIQAEKDMLLLDLQDLEQQLSDSQQFKIQVAQLLETNSSLQTKLNFQSQQILSQQKTQIETQQLVQDHEKQILQLRQNLQQKEDQLQQVNGRKKHMQIDLDHNLTQIKDLTSKLSSQNHKFSELQVQHEILVEQSSEQKQQFENQIQFCNNKEKLLQDKIMSLEDQLSQKETDLKQQIQQTQQLSSEFENVAQAFIQKKQIYKNQIQNLKQNPRDLQEVVELKAQLSQADQLIQQMQNETEQIVSRLQQKRDLKETKYKQKIAELESLNQEENKYAEEIAILKNLISEHKQAYQALKEDCDSNLLTKDEKIQELTKLQDEQMNSLLENKKAAQKQKEDFVVQSNETIEKMKQQFEIRIDELKEIISSHKQSYQDLQNKLQDDTKDIDEIKNLKETNQIHSKKLTELESELEQANQSIKEHEAEAQNLAQLFKQQKSELRDKNSKLKQEMRQLIQEVTQEQEQKLSTIQDLQRELETIQKEKLDISTSLDLTKIERAQNQSQFKLLETEIEQAQCQLQKLIALVKDYDDQSPHTFEQVFDLLRQLLQNGNEVQKSISQQVQEKDELQHEIDGLLYKLQIVAAERDQLRTKLDSSDKMLIKTQDNNESKSTELKSSLKGKEEVQQRSFFSSLFLTQSDLK